MARRARGSSRSPAPSGRRSRAGVPCRSRAPRGSQSRTRNSVPGRWRGVSNYFVPRLVGCRRDVLLALPLSMWLICSLPIFSNLASSWPRLGFDFPARLCLEVDCRFVGMCASRSLFCSKKLTRNVQPSHSGSSRRKPKTTVLSFPRSFGPHPQLFWHNTPLRALSLSALPTEYGYEPTLVADPAA
jgi:hypothetical protein